LLQYRHQIEKKVRRRVYSFLSQISNLLNQPFLNIANSTKAIPILSAFVLGIVGAMAPCQLTGNLGAITLLFWVVLIAIGFYLLHRFINDRKEELSPMEILKIRLAKGEITLDEFEQPSKKL
jgi:putative membrane protein